LQPKSRPIEEVIVPDPTPTPKRHAHIHLDVIATSASVVNGIAVLALTTLASRIGPGFMSWVAEWWGVVEGIVVLLQIPPLVARMPLAERKEVNDILSSWFDAAMVWAVVPTIYVTTMVTIYGWYSPNYWAWKIWVTSLPASLTDLVLLLVLLEVAKTVFKPPSSP
jgi:hypothetical protein